jgi:hypothetical protein
MITAKVVCNSKLITGGGEQRQAKVVSSRRTSRRRTKQWAKYTPSLQLAMVLNGAVADRFEPGQSYTLTFEPDAA